MIKQISLFKYHQGGFQMKTSKILIFLVLFAFLIVLSGCFPGERSDKPKDPAGFFTGIWHGWIAPISLIVGFFNPSIRIYETVNSGWWYDFGYYIAILGGFGGFSLVRRSAKKRD
jgi:hypothetical protein